MARMWALVYNGQIAGVADYYSEPGVDVSALFECVDVTDFPGAEYGMYYRDGRVETDPPPQPPRWRDLPNELWWMKKQALEAGLYFQASGADRPSIFQTGTAEAQADWLALRIAADAGEWTDGDEVTAVDGARVPLTRADILAFSRQAMRYKLAVARRAAELARTMDQGTDLNAGWPDRGSPDPRPAPEPVPEPPAEADPAPDATQ